LDFPVIYACARDGVASLEPPTGGALPADATDLRPLFDALLRTVPPPSYDDGAPLQAHVTNLDASPFLRRLALCRIRQGTIARGQTVAWCRRDGSITRVRVTELLMTEGLDRKPAERAGPGDIIAVAGIDEVTIGETLADPDDP